MLNTLLNKVFSKKLWISLKLTVHLAIKSFDQERFNAKMGRHRSFSNKSELMKLLALLFILKGSSHLSNETK